MAVTSGLGDNRVLLDFSTGRDWVRLVRERFVLIGILFVPSRSLCSPCHWLSFSMQSGSTRPAPADDPIRLARRLRGP